MGKVARDSALASGKASALASREMKVCEKRRSVMPSHNRRSGGGGAGAGWGREQRRKMGCVC